MKSLSRIALAIVTVCFIVTGYSLYNLKHLARNIGYDEVYYYYWVDNWENYQVYYPHHLLFTPTSVYFQKHFTELTGISSTAFIQRYKNILVVAAGLGLFFIVFYAGSRRYLLSLTVVILIGVSASLWHDVHHHETSAIPGILINLVVLSLLFYRKFPLPSIFIILVSALNAFAILS